MHANQQSRAASMYRYRPGSAGGVMTSLPRAVGRPPVIMVAPVMMSALVARGKPRRRQTHAAI
jgi:hypothetical protein